MTKTFCDRCGKEIVKSKYAWIWHKSIYAILKFASDSGTDVRVRDKDIYICPDCEKSFIHWYFNALIAQPPRVMTLEEILEYGDDKPLFIEYVLPTETVLKPAIFQPDNSEEEGYMCMVSAWRSSGFYDQEGYGKDWRCWTARPTDEQRKAVKWE